MALDSLIQYIVNPQGAYESGKQQVYKDLADYAYGASNAKLEAQDRNLALQADILSQQQSIDTQKLLQRTGIPKTSTGQTDYRALASMIAGTNPKLALDYSKEADNQDRIAETVRKDQMKERIDGIKAMSDDLSAVTDQASLDAFRTKAQALGYPLPQNFPTVYNQATAPQIAATGRVLAGQQKNLEAQYKLAQMATQRAEQTRDYDEAKRAAAAADLDRVKDARLRAGLPENPAAKIPSGWELDPNNPDTIRPIKGGPFDPTGPNYRAPTGSRPTVAEEKVTQNYITMKNAEDVLDSPAYRDKNLAFLASVQRDESGYFSAVDRFGRQRALTDDEQVLAQAAAQFAEGAGHAKSGARINKDTMRLMTQLYLPMPGDKPSVIQRKREARQNDIEAAKVAGGRGVERFEQSNKNKSTDDGWSIKPVQ